MKNAAAKLAKATDDEQVEGPELTGTLHFMQLLWELHHNLQARSKRMESTHGVTGPQRLVLRLVARYPGMSAGELAALLEPLGKGFALSDEELRQVLLRAEDLEQPHVRERLRGHHA